MLAPDHESRGEMAKARLLSDLTESNGWSHRSHSTIAKWQLAADCMIAVAYFSIPLELVYFLIKSQVLPFRWVVALFGTFIVLCGLTHLLTIWSFYANSVASHVGMTFAKAVTATVSCFTAVVLVWVIPELLDVKRREEFFTKKTAELDVEVGNIRKDQQVMKHVRMLTDEIRSSLDRHKILNTTMVQLSRTLELESCNIWLPKAGNGVLELVHKLGVQDLASSEIEISADIVQLVFGNNGAVVIPSRMLDSSSVMSPGRSDTTVAIRIPLLKTGTASAYSQSFALMLLAAPVTRRRPWSDHDLELVAAVADQVAVALSHAAVVEETLWAQERLIEQNLALQKAKKEAESAVIARNEFLVVMNHEMRTPMHAIVALSSLLLQSGSLTTDERSMVETISKSGSLLSTLINDVLDFSKLEAGSLVLDMHQFSLPRLLDDAERLLSPLAQAKRLPFGLKRMGDFPDRVVGDSTRILQLMLNVVGNAIKFTKEGHVYITAFTTRTVPLLSERRNLHVVVEDTGIGLRPTDIPRLFNKFVQADSSTSRKFGGTGLGLAISRKFVELMEGSISIESEGLGKGSTCRFQVCLALVKATEDAAAAPKVLEVDLKEVKILAVDDNMVNRTVIGRLLNNLGCKSTIVDSGQRCLEVLATEGGVSSYHLILLDLCMPEMDGFEVTEQIVKLYPERPLIVALTANTDENTRKRCFDEGMDGLMTKPLTLNSLKQQLNRELAAKLHSRKHNLSQCSSSSSN